MLLFISSISVFKSIRKKLVGGIWQLFRKDEVHNLSIYMMPCLMTTKLGSEFNWTGKGKAGFRDLKLKDILQRKCS